MQIREISHKVSNNNPEYSDATEILWPHPIYPRIIYHLRFLKYALDFIIFGCWNNSLKSNIYIRSQTHQTFVTEFGKPPPPLQCHWMWWCWPILAFYQPVCGIPLYCHLVCKLMTFHVHPRLWKLECLCISWIIFIWSNSSKKRHNHHQNHFHMIGSKYSAFWHVLWCVFVCVEIYNV